MSRTVLIYLRMPTVSDHLAYGEYLNFEMKVVYMYRCMFTSVDFR